MMYVIGPGHGGPGLVASAWLEGTYTEIYPDITVDEEGMRRLFTQFSFPGGIPSHVAPETPGSIHEGGELGYSLSHAYGAAFDNPDLVVAAVVGDGEAETGPLATSWHSNKFVDPRRDGAVLPILHLNGYKIANPTVLARIPEDELRRRCCAATATRRTSSPATTRTTMHQAFAATLDHCLDEIRDIQQEARDRAAAAGRAPALADDRAALPEGLDRPEGGRRPARSRAPGAPTRCRSPTPAATTRTARSSRTGCAATGPRSSSTRPARRSRRSPTCTRPVSGG